MGKLLSLVALSALVNFAMAQYCTPTHNANNNGHSLPTLPTSQFKTVIRAVIVNKGMTVEATEYVDETLNVAALKMVQNGVRATILMSYKTNEVFYMIPNEDIQETHPGPMSCILKNMSTDDMTSLFGMHPDPNVKLPHIVSTSQILNFINGSEVYRGRTNVSGIPTDHWSACLNWPQLYATFNVDYYFTIPGWQTPSGHAVIPVKAEIVGQATYPNGTGHPFHHIYQYVNFESYVDDPETLFETPPGVLCLGRKAVRQPPKLGNFFYYREEISNPASAGFALIQETDIWYDNSLALVRYDRRSAPSGVSRDFSLSKGPYTTIHDFTIGVQYVIANDLKICSIDPIPQDAQGFDATYNSTSQNLKMRNPAQFFHLSEGGYVYAGQRLARGQKCNVFQNLLTDIPGHGFVVYEVYFLTGADDVTDQGRPNQAAVVPMRILMWENGQLVNQYEIHDFDQNNIVSTQFDVTPCFPGKNSIDFAIRFSVPSTNLMPKLADVVQGVVLEMTTLPNGITALRLQNSRLNWDQYSVYFEGTLLGAAPSIAKFQQTKGRIMSQGLGKVKQNVYTDADCATQCDNEQDFVCAQFDYCPQTQVCTLGKSASNTTVAVNSSCTNYRRVLGGNFDNQKSLDDVWTSLRNQVYHRQLVINVPLPDANGNVDMNKLDTDEGPVDPSQVYTLTALYITNEVVSSVNRNPNSNNIMATFQTIPNKMGKGYNTHMKGMSVDDCASNCIGEITYNCQSFHYCWNLGDCYLSPLHPDERPDLLRDSTSCDLYFRDYTSNFQQFPGMTVVSSSNVIYQNVISASQCAKLCTYYMDFHCESFDFCTDISACYLSTVHYYDAPQANMHSTLSCSHFSRNYISDFVMKSHKTIQLRDNRIIQGVTAAQCAKLCVQEDSFNCRSFDYCGNYTECRLSDATTMGDGQVTLDSTAYCDVYIRQYGTAAPNSGTTGAPPVTNKPVTNGPVTNRPVTNRPVTKGPNPGNNNNQGTSGPQAQTSSSGYSGGAMAGLGVGMICLGLIVGIGLIMGYMQYFRRSHSGDGMTVAFSKQMETVST